MPAGFLVGLRSVIAWHGNGKTFKTSRKYKVLPGFCAAYAAGERRSFHPPFRLVIPRSSYTKLKRNGWLKKSCVRCFIETARAVSSFREMERRPERDRILFLKGIFPTRRFPFYFRRFFRREVWTRMTNTGNWNFFFSYIIHFGSRLIVFVVIDSRSPIKSFHNFKKKDIDKRTIVLKYWFDYLH